MDITSDVPLDTFNANSLTANISSNQKEVAKYTFLSIDKILDKISFGVYQLRIYLIIGLLSITEGAQVMVFTLMVPILEHQWNVDKFFSTIQMSIIFFSSLVGSIFSGKISDRNGRKTPFMYCSYSLIAISCLSAFSPNIYFLVGFRAILGLIVGIMVPLGTTIVAEITPIEMRGRYMSILGFAFSLGHIFGLLSSYAILDSLKNGNWRALIIICTLPALFACSLFNLFFDESPRYLLLNNHQNEAFEVIEKMINANSKGSCKILSDLQKKRLSEWADAMLQNQEKFRKGSFRSLFSRKLRRITILLWWNWFCSYFVYYGIVIFMPKVIDELQGTANRDNIFLILLSTVAEIIAITLTSAIIDIKYFGRKNSMIIFFCLTSIVCLIVYADSAQHFIIWISVTKLFMAMTNSFCTQYTVEIYPTNIRVTGYGMASAMGKLGGIIMPWTSLGLIQINISAPFLFFFGAAFSSSLASYLIPFDTQGMELDS